MLDFYSKLFIYNAQVSKYKLIYLFFFKNFLYELANEEKKLICLKISRTNWFHKMDFCVQDIVEPEFYWTNRKMLCSLPIRDKPGVFNGLLVG